MVSSVESCREIYTEIGRNIALNAATNDRLAALDRPGWAAVTDAGCWRLPVPTDLGGLGGDWTDCVRALDALSRTAEDLGFLVTTLGHLGSIRLLLDHGTTEQRSRWLPALLAGTIGVTAMTEAGGGSDLARMRLAAELTTDGWRLNGIKTHITNAPVAKLGLIAGRIPELGRGKDITLFFIDFDTPGISVGQTEDNLGIRTSPTADIIFENVPMTDINIIGAPGNGLAILHEIIAFERALYGVMAAGLIDGQIDRTLTRTSERMAFGRPLKDYQYVQGRITDMKMSAHVCRTLTYEALRLLEARLPEASIACSTTKFYAGEKLVQSAENMVQLHGHIGFANNDISRMLRDATGMRIAGGTSDIQRVNVFNQMTRQRDREGTNPA